MYSIQYIVVRTEIIMKYGFGFMAPQICHASMAPITAQIKSVPRTNTVDYIFDKDTMEWIEKVFYKCVLEATDDQMHILRDRLDADNIIYYPIVESKIKELTTIGLKPYNKGRVAPYFKNLKLLGGNIPE